MLVSQPRTSTEIAGPLGGAVCVSTGELDGIRVGVIVAVIKDMLVEVGRSVAVGICSVGVALGAIITGVAVKIDGVLVGGRNGVGGFPGWITQPLQDAIVTIKNIVKIVNLVVFISSPHHHCTPHAS